MTPKKQCLVVDDSDVIRRVARQLLASMEFDVTEAVSGQLFLVTIVGAAVSQVGQERNRAR